ncbi:TetR/AcrR family transcriptional regulator [Streptomyces apocyni]|uniref:TetR/AcrR family transcriptional regulator n=1 Tax=Streptomyces apocyni TaxID=2654677 RepID=UPI0012E9F887|nr:TetR/AcrR family transcriptional regulator [Streptomyces apocyni]
MARVSQEHLDARRRQILDGAARCFARNGFHATSMQDVLREADLSAGAVYRYFRSKEELIGAIAEEVLTAIHTTFEAAARQSPPPPPDVLVAQGLREVFSAATGLTYEGKSGFARMMIQAWTETLRNEELAAVLHEGFGRVRAAWVRIVEAYQQAGLMRTDVSPESVARTMIAVAQGFAVQQALFGDAPVELIEEGLRGVMSMGDGAGEAQPS